ncbi:oligosaccharide flippase family protein [Mesorhizobium sp. M1156]|uniref:lipopolysaccharide biosynthesis protein n=1 Tax=unclassified Mesorhizobium TaxID=325217 RepID=UPI003338F09D
MTAFDRHVPRHVRATFLALRSVGLSRLGRNVFANYFGSMVNAAVPLLVLPFILHALGRTMWGLVAFSTLIVTVMSLFNAGMAQSMVREFGSRWAAGDSGRLSTARLLYSYERIYWCAALGIALGVLPCSDVIVTHWLNIGEIPHKIAVGAIYCAIALFFVQLPAAIYKTVLTSLQEQVWLNGVQASFTLLKGLGGMLVATISGSVLAYLAFIVLAVLCETLTVASGAWRRMPVSRSTLGWDTREVRNTMRYSVTMSVLVILGVLTTQVDKLYVSSKLPIDQLGIYSIAYSLAMGVLQIGYPIFTAVLPRLVQIGGDQAMRRRLNGKLFKLVALIILTVGIIYAVAGRTLLALWLRDEVLANQVAKVLDWLMVSSALNTIYNVAYINWVSQAETRWLSVVNIVSFILAVSITPLSIDAFGLRGAAFALVSINLVGSLGAVLWLVQNARSTGKERL